MLSLCLAAPGLASPTAAGEAATPTPAAARPEPPLREVPPPEVLDMGPAFRGAHRAVLGLDGAFSVPLAPGRSLWVFGDTLLGGWRPGGDRHIRAMPPSAAAQVADNDWVTGFTHARFSGARLPTPVLEGAAAGERLWPLDAFHAANALWLGFVGIRPRGTGPFDFDVTRVGLARRRPGPGMTFTPAAPLGEAGSPLWGSSVVRHDAWLYLFAGGAPTRLARLPAARPDAVRELRFWTGSGWSPRAADAAALPDAGPELSVRWSPHLQAFLMVWTPVLGRSVEARLAPKPTGPWGPARRLLALGAGDPEALFYGAKHHAELDAEGGRRIVLTYNTNAPSARLAARPDLYWPHLVRVTFPATP
jgi:hypothetical protein